MVAPWLLSPACAVVSLVAHVLKAAPAICLHVPHSAHGLDLGVVGAPLVPLLVSSHLQHVLVTTVARVLVAHPTVEQRESDRGRERERCPN